MALDGNKRPIHAGWPERDTRPDECGLGVGIALGVRSGGLVDVDLDSPEARALARWILPETPAVFSSSQPFSHWLYLAPEAVFRQYRDPIDRSMLLELRTSLRGGGEHKGNQTAFPPTAGREWPDGTRTEPAPVDPSKACARLAAGALLVRYWPGQGGRDETAMALAGALLRAGWGADEADDYLELIAATAGDEESSSRRKAERTAAELEREAPVTGLGRLRELLDPRVVSAIADWLDLGQPAPVAEELFSDTGLATLAAGHGAALFEHVAEFVQLRAADPARFAQVLVMLGAAGIGQKTISRLESLVSAELRRAPALEGFLLSKEGKPIANEHNVAIALRGLYPGLSFDEFTRRTTIDGIEWTDSSAVGVASTIQRECELNASASLVHSVAAAPHPSIPQTHQVRDYLNALPTWDGIPRLVHLPQVFGVDDSELARAYWRVWMLAAVRRVLWPGVKFDDILTLVGDEGLFKSSGFEALAVRPEWFGDTDLDFADVKSCVEKITGTWLYEIQEIDSKTRKEMSDVKRFASSKRDRFRAAYGRATTMIPRQTAFCASTNKQEFLLTHSGDRRLLIMQVRRPVDLTWLVQNRNAFWAEAFQAAQTNEAHWLEGALKSAAAEDREQYRADDPQLERVRAWLATQDPARGVTTTEAIEQALLIMPNVAHPGLAQKVAGMLRKCGWGERRQSRDGIDRSWRYFPR